MPDSRPAAPIPLYASVAALAAHLTQARLIVAEFMYKPRPAEPRRQAVFDYAFNQRMQALKGLDTPAAVVLICADEGVVASLQPLINDVSSIIVNAVIVNPPLSSVAAASSTPHDCGWPTPDRWQALQYSDRWARITAALTLGHLLEWSVDYICMPAHDAVYSSGLLQKLIERSRAASIHGVPAAISPYTPFQHSAVPSIAINAAAIHLLNAAFNRDPMFMQQIMTGNSQGFWGKMGLLPGAVCGALLAAVDRDAWEDDLELERALQDLGYGVTCWWESDPRDYRLAPPVFTRSDVRRVIERTLHYSLKIPGRSSAMTMPLTYAEQRRRAVNPTARFWGRQAEALIEACYDEMMGRVRLHGCSWVDWGDYRYVARPRDPAVEVWKLL